MEKAHLDKHPLLGAVADGEQSFGADAEIAPHSIHLRQVVGGVLIFGGIIAVIVSWFGISGTLDPGKQMPYLISGGIGGAMAVAIGVTSLISNEHARDRDSLDELYGRLEAMEATVDGIEEHLVRLRYQVIEAVNGKAATSRGKPVRRADAAPVSRQQRRERQPGVERTPRSH